MGHWPSCHQVFALQVIPFSFWWLLSVKALSVWIFHSRVQGRFFSYLRKFLYFSCFMTHYKDLAFKNKTFCFIINLNGEKVWNHIAQMHRRVQRGTQLGEFSCTTPGQVSLQNPRQLSAGGGVCKFFLLVGEFQSWDQDASTHWLLQTPQITRFQASNQHLKFSTAEMTWCHCLRKRHQEIKHRLNMFDGLSL